MRQRLFVSGCIILLVVIISTALINTRSSPTLLLASGTLLNPSLPLTSFTLIDHRYRPFTSSSLLGRWHLLSYGFVRCANTCPTSLRVVQKLKQRLVTHGLYDDLRVLFYSVDPRRDNEEMIGEFVAHFGADILGLKAIKNELGTVSKNSFEQDLSMRVVITEGDNPEDYRVNHGVVLYLINPQARLHAVFHPTRDAYGRSQFDVENLYEDYILVRRQTANGKID